MLAAAARSVVSHPLCGVVHAGEGSLDDRSAGPLGQEVLRKVCRPHVPGVEGRRKLYKHD